MASTTTAEETEFLRKRLALVAKLAFLSALGVAGFLQVLRRWAPALAPFETQRELLLLLGGPVAFGGSWLLFSRVRFKPGGLAVMEAALFVVISVLLAFAAFVGWRSEPGRYGVGAGAIVLAFTRALLVPTRWTKTLLISTILVLGPLTGNLLRAFYPVAGVQANAAAPIAFGIIWGSIAIALSTIGSHIIHGLRREVQNAQKLGQYTLERKLGEGGMGEVYLGRHALLRRPTAVKLLPKGKAGDAAINRFQQEVQLTANLRHPNTVSIFDYGRAADGTFYYVMEFLDGLNLSRLVADAGPLPVGRTKHILEQVCAALHEAHAAGLVHRDIKPANIVVTDHGGEPDFVKVVDFGLVKELSGDAQLTQNDVLCGTPAFMAPEALTDPERVGPRTDIYSLGAVGYFLLTGHDVFEGKTIVEVCSQHLHSSPAPISTRRGSPIEPRLEALILRCLEKRMDARPSDARSLLDDLRRIAVNDDWSPTAAALWWQEHRNKPLSPSWSSAEAASARSIAVAFTERRP